MSKELKVDANWTNDCQGKKDYDGHIVSVTTRYWPEGGGFSLLSNTDGQITIEGNEARPHIKASANSSIVLWFKDADGEGSGVDLIEKEFTGNSEDDVKAQVEAWVQSEFDKISNILITHYTLLTPTEG